ncbi:hypothetical protein ACFSMW_14530 [Virgibacillus halophilus]
MFLNFFPVNGKWVAKAGYICLWTILLTLFEWAAVHIGRQDTALWQLEYMAVIDSLSN